MKVIEAVIGLDLIALIFVTLGEALNNDILGFVGVALLINATIFLWFELQENKDV